MADTKFKFEEVQARLKAMHSTLPIQLANVTQLHFTSAFTQEGYDGVPWAVPKRRIEGTPEYKYPMNKGLGRRTQSTLIKTGRLKRAVNMSLRSASFERISFFVDVPYAGFQNFGTSNIPARPFMIDSLLLRVKQMEKINSAIKKAFNT